MLAPPLSGIEETKKKKKKKKEKKKKILKKKKKNFLVVGMTICQKHIFPFSLQFSLKFEENKFW